LKPVRDVRCRGLLFALGTAVRIDSRDSPTESTSQPCARTAVQAYTER
jgi:hypothetical protein